MTVKQRTAGRAAQRMSSPARGFAAFSSECWFLMLRTTACSREEDMRGRGQGSEV